MDKSYCHGAPPRGRIVLPCLVLPALQLPLSYPPNHGLVYHLLCILTCPRCSLAIRSNSLATCLVLLPSPSLPSLMKPLLHTTLLAQPWAGPASPLAVPPHRPVMSLPLRVSFSGASPWQPP
eukprot:Gb_10904 [translate_table: standard]